MLALDWDDANRDHVARHGITMAEFEEVLLRDPFDLGYREEQGEMRFSFLGETARGRILLVVVTERGDLLRPVTAFEPGTTLRKHYLQSRRSQ
jgi:uncharacterized DUF497 family protein